MNWKRKSKNRKIETFAQICIEAINKGNKIMIFGCGGSAAMAQHFAAELVGKYKYERRALPALALTTDTSILTSISNDYSFDKVFTRQLEALSKEGDIVIALSTSGKSVSVLEALEWGREHGLIVCDFERIGDSTPEIQENQLVALHELAEFIEKAFI